MHHLHVDMSACTLSDDGEVEIMRLCKIHISQNMKIEIIIY